MIIDASQEKLFEMGTALMVKLKDQEMNTSGNICYRGIVKEVKVRDPITYVDAVISFVILTSAVNDGKVIGFSKELLINPAPAPSAAVQKCQLSAKMLKKYIEGIAPSPCLWI